MNQLPLSEVIKLKKKQLKRSDKRIKEKPIKPIKLFNIIDFKQDMVLENATEKEVIEFLNISYHLFRRFLDSGMRCKGFYYIESV